MVDLTVEVTDEVAALIADVELIDVSFFEMTAVRAVPPATSEAEDSEASREIQTTHFLSFEKKDDGTAFRVSLRTSVVSAEGSVVVRAVAEYGLSALNCRDYTNLQFLEFTNITGTMTLVPYLRHGIADLSQRVFGTALLLPIIRRGELEFTPADAADADD